MTAIFTTLRRKGTTWEAGTYLEWILGLTPYIMFILFNQQSTRY